MGVFLVDGYKVLYLLKTSITDTLDHEKVLGFTKWTVTRAILNDLRRKSRSDTRKIFKLDRIGRVDVDRCRACAPRSIRRDNLSGSAAREDEQAYKKNEKRNQMNVWEIPSKHFHNFRAIAVCKMLKVSMLQTFELTIFVKIRHFSTEIVENPTGMKYSFQN